MMLQAHYRMPVSRWQRFMYLAFSIYGDYLAFEQENGTYFAERGENKIIASCGGSLVMCIEEPLIRIILLLL
jgi:hypothetical protein